MPQTTTRQSGRLESIEQVEEDATTGTPGIVPVETKRLCDESLV
jgi:hypothetical protein